MQPVSAKILGVRIYGATAQTKHMDGEVSCDVIIHPDDLARLKASGLVAWESTQPPAECPARFKRNGELMAIWAGVHYEAVGQMIEAALEEPIEP